MEGEKIKCGVILPWNEVTVEITKHNFYPTLSLYTPLLIWPLLIHGFVTLFSRSECPYKSQGKVFVPRIIWIPKRQQGQAAAKLKVKAIYNNYSNDNNYYERESIAWEDQKTNTLQGE